MKAEKPIFIILIVLMAQISFGQDGSAPRTGTLVDFFKEEITLSVNDSFAAVSGIYYFRNNSAHEGRMPIIFPFYVDSASLYPDTICAYIINKTDTTEIDTAYLDHRDASLPNAVMIAIPLVPQKITVWHLDYRQRILGNRATYILTSTGAWGKPLEEATYRFIVAPSLLKVQVWPEADSAISDASHNEYLARRTKFMPKQDMTIEWEAKK